jgi:ABC-type glycerol-3-phosphate transport system substrate-binding protein
MSQGPIRRYPGWALLAAAFLGSVFWVFTRSVPLGDDRPVTLRIAHWQIEQGPPEGIDAVIKRYEELNPRVRVKQVRIPATVYRQWLRANFSGGIAPDIVEYGAWLDGLADFPARYFEPMTTELMEPNPHNAGTPLAGRPWIKTFVDELLEQRLNSPEPGQYYAVNLTRGSVRLFCNRELLREIAGTDVPPRTLIELRQVFARTTERARRTGQPLHALAGSRDNAMWLMEYYMGGLMIRRARSLDLEGVHGVYPRHIQRAYLEGSWHFADPELQAGLAVLQDFARQMRPGFLQLGRDEAVREFLSGEALFIFAGTWDATTLRRSAPFTVAALRLPQATRDDPVVGSQVMGPFSDGDNSTSFGFYLNRRGPNRATAVDFLRFLTSYEGSRIFSANSGWVSGIAEVPVPPELAAHLSPGDGYSYGANFIFAGPHLRMAFERNLHQLVGPQGTVESMASVLEAEAPAAVRADLRIEQRTANVVVLPQDARIAALGHWMATTEAGVAARLRLERLEAAQTQSEARALMIGRWLQAAEAAGPK